MEGIRFCAAKTDPQGGMFHRFRHSFNSAREVVWPALVGAGPYVLACLAIGVIAWFVWQGGASLGENPSGEPSEKNLAARDLYVAAEALANEEDMEGARKAMEELAPLESGGDVRAHWWLAKDLLTRGKDADGEKTKASKGAALSGATSHLEEVVERDEANTEAIALLAQAYVLSRDLPSAFRLIDEKGSALPQLHLMGADLAAGLGDRRRRDRYGVAASAHFKRVCSDPDLEGAARQQARFRWAWAELALENFGEAREIIRESLSGQPNDQEKRSWELLLLQSWLGLIQAELAAGSGDSEVIVLLEEAAGELGCRRELVEVAGAVASRSGNTLGVELGLFYERMAENEGDLAEEVALGSLALALDRTDDGLAHLERAISWDPEHVVALNNLSYGLAFLVQPPEIERALELIDRAVAAGRGGGQLPFNCWETRGQVLAKAERWAEAVPNLERALNGMRGHIGIHRTLAQAYDALGQAALAEQHGKMVRDLENPDPKTDP